MPKSFFSRKIFRVIAVMVIFGTLVFVNPSSFFFPVRFFLFEITHPFQKLFSFFSFKVAGAKEFVTSVGRMKEENRNLFKENQRLSAENALLNDIKKENETLRREINLLPRNKFDLESAFVIGQDQKGIGSWIIIDKGARSGMEKNMPVIVSDGILVGKISEVFGESSKVVLLTNAESTVNASTVGNQSKGVVNGKYGLGVVFGMVLETDALNKGEDLITSGIGGDMPRGLLIGRLQDIAVSQDGLYQESSVLPAVRYSDLSVVSVIKRLK